MEKIGLEAVVKMDSFQRGMREYCAGTDQMLDDTEELSRGMDDLGYKMDAGAMMMARAVDWALGQIRQDLGEAVKDVYASTEEWEELTGAYDDFWRAVVISAAPRGDLLEFLSTFAGKIDAVSGKVLEFSAQQTGYAAVLDELNTQAGPLEKAFEFLYKIPTARQGGMMASRLAVWAENQGWLNKEVSLGEVYMEAYNERLKQNTEALDEVSGATEREAEKAKAAQKMIDELTQLRERASDKYQDYITRGLAAEEQYNQRVVDMNIKRARRLEDLDRQLAQRRQQVAQQLAQRLAEIEAQETQDSEQARYDHARRMAEIEEQYQEQRRQILKRYQLSMFDAIANRDATAALRAMRTRREELDEAKRDRDKQNADANTDYARQQAEQKHNLELQRQQAHQAYQQQLADLAENRQEQEAELDHSLQRELEDLERHNKWKLDAMRLTFLAEYKEAMQAYTSQEALYAQHLANMREIWGRLGGGFGQPPGGTQGFIGGYAEGGSFVTGGPTTATFGEAGVPELVTAIPLRGLYSDGGNTHQVSGAMQFDVGGQVEAMLHGYEGRLSGAISGAVHAAIRDVLR